MRKAFHVAKREFLATVLTKAFIIGVVLPPLLMGMAFTLMPLLMNQKPPKTEGRIAVIDQSRLLGEHLQAEFTPEKLSESRKRRAERTKQQVKTIAPQTQGPGMNTAMDIAIASMPVAALTLEPLPAETNPETAKAEIPKTRGKKDAIDGPPRRLALAVIPPGAVKMGPREADAEPFAEFELYTAPSVDMEVKDQIEEALQRAIVDARLSSNGLDVSNVLALTKRPVSKSVTMTETGEHKTNEAAAMLIPGAFLMLLWISVFTAGQALLTGTIEEKSNRVMEVLLSAVSPVELMVGKIVGQMAVGAVMLGVYAGVGVASLVYFAWMHLIDPINLVYLAVYFVIAFSLIASMMAAVGSAVSDIREAQSLIGPVMIVMVIPMLLWFPILRNPNSLFATTCSFLPPISPFIMVLRLCGSEPVPFWQVPVSIALGFIYVAIGVWACAKIFRIGILMYGKPPNFGTLIKWIRMA